MEAILMFLFQNGFYLAVMALAGAGIVYNQTTTTKVHDDAVKIVQEERDKAIKASVGRYVIDPATGATGFQYGSQ